jgi:hypothetical protein
MRLKSDIFSLGQEKGSDVRGAWVNRSKKDNMPTETKNTTL